MSPAKVGLPLGRDSTVTRQARFVRHSLRSMRPEIHGVRSKRRAPSVTQRRELRRQVLSRRRSGRAWSTSTALLALSAIGCGETPGAPAPAAPRTGFVTVVVNVNGNGTDPDGFSASLGGRSVTLQPNTPTTVASVPPGSYALRLSGLAPQCATNADTASAAVVAGDTAAVRFVVTCYGAVAFEEAVTPDNFQAVYLGEDGRIVQLTTGAGRNYLQDWSPDGARVLFETDRNGNLDLYTVRADGSDLRRLTTHPYQDEQPHWSPDGRWIVFHRTPYQSGPFEHAWLNLVSADGTAEKVLLDTLHRDFDPTWAPDGSQIIFSCDRFGRIWDLCSVKLDGTGLRSVLYSDGAQHAEWSPDSARVAFQSFAGGQAIWIAGVDGSNAASLTPGLVSFDFAWSPDGARLVLATYDGAGGYSIQRVNRDGTGLTALTPIPDAAGDGRWSPDGTRIAFYSQRGGEQQIWVMNPDGSSMHPITSGPEPKFHPRWNPRARPGANGAAAVADASPAGDDRLAPLALPAAREPRAWRPPHGRCARAAGLAIIVMPCGP